MKGSEFIRRVHRLGRRRGVSVQVIPERGKGSHRLLYYGLCRTTVRDPKDELKSGTFHAMLKQLGLTAQDLSK